MIFCARYISDKKPLPREQITIFICLHDQWPMLQKQFQKVKHNSFISFCIIGIKNSDTKRSFA
ncbi:hypothetical protein Hanom_Chr07g00608591 [Helianthus anomalus]